MAIEDEETSSPPLKSQIEGVFEDKIDSKQRLPIKEKAIFLFCLIMFYFLSSSLLWCKNLSILFLSMIFDKKIRGNSCYDANSIQNNK